MPHRTTPLHPTTDNAPPAAAGDPWYTTDELARLLKLDPSTLRRWRTARPSQGPPFVRLSGRVVLYSAADVRQWLAERRTVPGQAA
ncbi:AlpA family transcriptional regulator [Streptomyces sp. NEAU-YJ-81]|uniref:helix-turn-helix transcriptional regulator n=1 Tax=Streptomyces sp. NEAU-YJ-81 TaxID=2820288 RepID=UPI001ABCE356|nr:helix-turn-helix domain-containing protein [Streptomyces sp. NEAU-YJ-81]MBO3682554.1 helix-turn-helix domain-containing protein [Streptomyces sp. NEAU-YJ-81]